MCSACVFFSVPCVLHFLQCSNFENSNFSRPKTWITDRIISNGVTGGGGGAKCPRDFWPGNFCWRIGKKEAKKKGKRGENWEEKKENCKREGGKLETEVGKAIKRGELFFFFFFFFFFLLFTFENDGNLFWVHQNGNFLPGKAFHAGKKIRKNDFAPSEKYACYAPDHLGKFSDMVYQKILDLRNTPGGGALEC